MNAVPPARLPLAASPESQATARVLYWQKTRRLTLALLVMWFGVTLLVSWFARDIDIVLAGWPLSFWAAAEGALVVYVLIVAFYGWTMDRLDAECRAAGLSAPADAP